MSTVRVTKVTLAQRVRDLIAGTQKHSPNGQLTLGGETFTAQALIQVLQNLGDALSTVDTAKASWKPSSASFPEQARLHVTISSLTTIRGILGRARGNVHAQ
jgi:hypothetical protein